MSTTMTPQQAQAAAMIRKIGWGLLLVAVLLVAVPMAWGMMNDPTGDKLERAWASQTPVAKEAFCGSMERDLYFYGPARGLASLTGDPNIDEHDAYQFLLDKCFPGQ